MLTSKVRVLVVDDSAVVRAILKRALSEHPAIEVVGLAADGLEALQQIRIYRPDVVTLDVEMPKLNGLEVLGRAAGKVPVSFVMCSTLTQAGARTTFEALQKGAFDYIPKPEHGGFSRDPELRAQLHAKILAAARAKGRLRRITRPAGAPTGAVRRLPPSRARGWVVGVGVSCGGPQALCEMLPVFPSNFVPIVITQHMPAQFTPSFAQHLDRLTMMNVREAQDGSALEPGTILIAPGSHHLRLWRHGVKLSVKLDDGPKVGGHRPSVDVMFSSLAKACGPRCIGVIMTGMGHDGAAGIQELRRHGAGTVAQDEASSLVYGMPRAAIATGAIDRIAALAEIPQVVARLLETGGKTPSGLVR
jgi:two-component system chemotaxis response regulator CheB